MEDSAGNTGWREPHPPRTEIQPGTGPPASRAVMSAAHRTHLDALLDALLAAGEADRTLLLAERCGDPALRAELQELLRLATNPPPGLEPGTLASRHLLTALAEELSAEELRPGQRVGVWSVVCEIGRGGMGAVYLVERADGEFQQRGALKLARSATSADISRRLKRERRILASLTHPHIARLLDGGQTHDGRPFLVMEYVEGRPIDRYCDEERLAVPQRLDIFLHVCAALQHAHRQLVVHGDVKPSNVVVTCDGDVKLLDFGIARLLSIDEDAIDGIKDGPAVRVLTPEYASPEQVRGERVGIASDVYQLGLMLYELLSGSRGQLVADVAADALRRSVCDETPPLPSARAAASVDAAACRRTSPAALARTLGGDLDSIVQCALRKQPDRRYASVGELLDDVRRCQAARPVRARGRGWTYRAGRFVVRNRSALAWTAAVTIVTAVMLPAAVEQRWRAQREAERAQQVERLIGNLFAFHSPRVRPEAPRALDLADHAAALVRSELQREPLIQARLLTRIGRVYNALGHYDRSIGALDEALVLYRSGGGIEQPADLADTLEWLGQSQHYSGRYGEAEATLHEALAIRRRSQGPEHRDTIRLSIELGDLLHTRGALIEAEGLLRDVVRVLRQLELAPRAEDLGHESLPRALRDLAGVLRDRGALDEARSLYLEAIELYRSLHGEPDQQVAVSQIYFSRLLVMRRDLEEAEAVLGESLPTLRNIYDGEHALIGIALWHLAVLRIEQGRLREAEDLLAQAQRIQFVWLGPGHPMEARARAHEADLAWRRGETARAAALATQVVQALDTAGMARHPAAIDARWTLGRALLAEGDTEAAAREFRRALEAARQQFISTDARLAQLSASLQRALDRAPAVPSRVSR